MYLDVMLEIRKTKRTGIAALLGLFSLATTVCADPAAEDAVAEEITGEWQCERQLDKGEDSPRHAGNYRIPSRLRISIDHGNLKVIAVSLNGASTESEKAFASENNVVFWTTLGVKDGSVNICPIHRVVINNDVLSGVMMTDDGLLKYSGRRIAAIKDKSIGKGALYWLMNRACSYGDALGVQMLLDAGADPDGVKDYAEFQKFEPSWPINQACRGGHTEIVQMLLKAGAKVDSVEGEGYTALTIASMKNHPETVKVLLDAGADVDFKAPEGTALDIAKTRGFDEVVKAIETRKRGE